MCNLTYSLLSYVESVRSFRLEHLVPEMNRAVVYFDRVMACRFAMERLCSINWEYKEFYVITR